MKPHSIRRAAIPLLIVGAACRPADGPHRTEDLAAIRALDDAYVAAVEAHDWEGLAALFKEDGVLLPPNEAAVVGRTAILDRGKGLDLAAVDYSHTEIDIGGTSGVAYLQGSYTTSITLGSGAGPYEDSGKYLWILERQPDGVWLIEKAIWNSDLPLPSM